METTNDNSVLVTKEKRKLIKNLTLDVLYKCKIHSLPVDLIPILDLYNITLLDSNQAVKYGFIDFCYHDFDGKNVYIDGYRLIIYNLKHVVGRQR